MNPTIVYHRRRGVSLRRALNVLERRMRRNPESPSVRISRPQRRDAIPAYPRTAGEKVEGLSGDVDMLGAVYVGCQKFGSSVSMTGGVVRT